MSKGRRYIHDPRFSGDISLDELLDGHSVKQVMRKAGVHPDEVRDLVIEKVAGRSNDGDVEYDASDQGPDPHECP